MNILENKHLKADLKIIQYIESPMPFVKWAGGKRNILKILLKNIPDSFNEYYEPFVGGGALFFNLVNSHKSYISDKNAELIITYKVIKENPTKLVPLLDEHLKNHSKDYYYNVRENIPKDPFELASRFIYLNKSCFNGLYRVNKDGKFNVPMGNYNKIALYSMSNLMSIHNCLISTEIDLNDFSQITPKKGDFVYFDPPYHKTFTNYTKDSFSEEDQIKLRNFCDELNNRGIYFMLSNSNTDFIKNIFANYNIQEITANRTINSDPNGRKNGKEVLVKNY